MTPADFRAARLRLGLSQSQLGIVLNVDARTIRKWEQDHGTNARQKPNPVAQRVMRWLLDGYEPPELKYVKDKARS